MPRQDAWERWCKAVDHLAGAADELRGLRHLPDGHPHKLEAWRNAKAAQAELVRASTEMEAESQSIVR